MAKPIPLELPPRDKRQEMLSRLESAPVEHAEAILAGYEVLQGLYESGILEFMRGLLCLGDKVLGTAVDAARAPESVRIIRNLVLLRKMLSEIDPEQFEGFVEALPAALQKAKEQGEQTPGLLSTLNQFRNKDLLRGIGVINTLLETWGRTVVSSANGPSKS
jgi:uncharacterized protein YjgD (DUF1641 family)